MLNSDFLFKISKFLYDISGCRIAYEDFKVEKGRKLIFRNFVIFPRVEAEKFIAYWENEYRNTANVTYTKLLSEIPYAFYGDYEKKK